MQTFFFLLLILSLIGLIIGLIKPSRIKMPSRKRVGMIFGGAAVLFFILIGVAAPSRSPASSTAALPQQSQAGSFIDKAMGDDVVLATLQFKVLDVKEQNAIKGTFGTSVAPNPGAKFVVIKLEVTNLTNSNIYYPNDIPLVDGQGRQYANYDKTIGNIDNYLDVAVLAPSIPRQGFVVYEVPVSSTSYFLESGKTGTNDIYRVKLEPSASAPIKQAATTPTPVQPVKTVTQTPPPPQKSTSSIKANGSTGSITIPYNTPATISWSSTNTTFCNVSPSGWTGGSGSQNTDNLTTKQTYTLFCTGVDGVSTPNVSVTVNVQSAPPVPITLSGSGQQATQQFTLQQGLSVFTMQNSGQSNFIVHLLNSSGNTVEGLANVIGSFSGSQAVKISVQGSYLLNVDSDGPWTITITQPRTTSAPSSANLSGRGPEATAFFSLSSGLHMFAFTHDGSSNFIVHLLDKNGNSVESLVNEIGAYSGSKAEYISSGIYLLNVEADGNWAVQIQ